MPGGGNCMPAGGEPAGPPGGANPGGRPCGRAGIPIKKSESPDSVYMFLIYTDQVGSWACPVVVRNLVADLAGAAACLWSVSIHSSKSICKPIVHTSRETRRHSTRRHGESGRKTSRRHHSSRRAKPRWCGVQHGVVRRLSLGRV